MTVNKINRYTDEDLNIFKSMLEQKLQIALSENINIKDRVDNLKESMKDDFNWVEDSAVTMDLEMFYSLLNRNQKHINDLQNALLRIKNKTYGICVLTGQLIDKKRLVAVPTTTKGIIAKQSQQKNSLSNRFSKTTISSPTKTKGPIEFSRIIKPIASKASPIEKDNEEYDEDLLDDTFNDILDVIESTEEE